MSDEITVQANFIEDVRTHALAMLHQSGIGVPANTLNDAAAVLEAYFNVVLKAIEPRARRVRWSKELSERTLAPDILTGVQLIVARSVAGESLSPHFSKGATKAHTNDWLLNHVRVHHLHVCEPQGDELLFVWVEPDDLYLLDVRGHAALAGVEPLEIVLSNWPALLGPPMGMGAAPMSQDEINQARRAGLNPIIRLSDGNCYMPAGTGLLTGSPGNRGTSCEAGVRADAILNRAHTLEELFRTNRDKASHDAGVTALHVRYDPAANVIIETNTGYRWPVEFHD